MPFQVGKGEVGTLEKLRRCGIVEDAEEALSEQEEDEGEDRKPEEDGENAAFSDPFPTKVAPILVAGRTSVVILSNIVSVLNGEDAEAGVGSGGGPVFGVAEHRHAEQGLDTDPRVGRGDMELRKEGYAADTHNGKGAEEVDAKRQVKTAFCFAKCQVRNCKAAERGNKREKTHGDGIFERLFSWISM